MIYLLVANLCSDYPSSKRHRKVIVNINVSLAVARPWQSTKRKIEYVSSDEENPDDPDPVKTDEEDDVIAMYKPKKSKLNETVQKNVKTVIDVTPLKDTAKSSPKPNVVYVSKYFVAKTEKLVSKKEEEADSEDDEKTRVKDKDSKRQSKNYFFTHVSVSEYVRIPKDLFCSGTEILV